MRFELNEGQTDSRVKFMARGAGSTLFLTNTDAVLALARPRPDRTAHKTSGLQPRTTPSMLPALHDALPRPMVESAVRLRFVGANSHAQVIGLDRLPGVSNYFIGKDRRMWRTNVPSYARVEYRDLYPGIDLVYYGNQGHLEYDLVVKPGATPGMIKLAIAGAAQPRLDARGNLLLSLHGNVVRQALPVAYQQEGRSVRRAIRTRYTLLGRHTVGSFDRRKPLTIDPVLSYSTYLGGTGGDGGGGIAVDATGDAYVTGSTSSSDFPTTPGAFETTYHGGYLSFGGGDAFVTKLNATGSALVYSTYLGGGKEDDGHGIAVDAMGDAYITGSTDSSDFPTTPGAFETTDPGGVSFTTFTAFVTKFDVRDTTGANGSLANEISRLRIETDGLLTGNNGLAVAAGNAASDGDALAAASTTDKAKLLANVLSDLQGAISPAAEAKAGLSSGEDVADLSVPGAEKGALSHITAFIQQSDSNKALFNQTLLNALKTRSADGITKDIVSSGVLSYGHSVGLDELKNFVVSKVIDLLQHDLTVHGDLMCNSFS